MHPYREAASRIWRIFKGCKFGPWLVSEAGEESHMDKNTHAGLTALLTPESSVVLLIDHQPPIPAHKASRCAASDPPASRARWCWRTACRSTTASAAGSTGTP